MPTNQAHNALIPRKRLYTILEGAEYLGHTEWGMRSLIWENEIPVVRKGRKIFIDLYDLDAFIKKYKAYER